jgi:proteic killer suppression protein
MIKNFTSKALKRFWFDADARGLKVDHVEKIAAILADLNAATVPEDMNRPGYRFHGLQGKPKRYAVTVNKNWRITFAWSVDGADAVDVDYIDYH